MKPKTIVKLATDALMTVLLLFLMGYQFWGDKAHEWIGAGMLVLFIAHHILNQSWYKNIFRGRYTAIRVLTLCVDLLVLCAMLAQMYSGIVMSRYVFDFLPVTSGMSAARRLHILGSYWGFLMMSFHLGLHWNMIINMLRGALSLKKSSRTMACVMNILAAAAAGYGAYAFFKRDFPTYLFLKSEFVFLDYGEMKILFYADYLAMMVMCVFVAHCCFKLCHAARRRKSRRSTT